MHSDVVQSDIHSTDEHGFSEAVFGATHLLGLSCAPRFRNLKRHVLHHFRGHGGGASQWMVAPTGYVNGNVIRASWDDLLRPVATIRPKEATASGILRRLNPYSRQHSLYRAVRAFGQIIKSLFILRHVDEVDLRRAIGGQPDKAELANSFTRAIAVGNPRGPEHADKVEQEIAESCSRLIRNSIVRWNHLYMSRRLEAARTQEERDRLPNTVAVHSPQSWGHFNLLGEYGFSRERLQDSTGVPPPRSIPGINPENREPPVR